MSPLVPMHLAALAAKGAPQGIHPAAFNPSPEAQQTLVLARANPFALRWIPATVSFDMTFGNDNPKINGVVHGGNSPQSNRIVETQWYQVIIQAHEYVYDPASFNPSLDEIKVAVADPLFGIPSSMLKVRIEVALGYGKTRILYLDIGNGINTFIAGKYINKIEVLVPDPTSFPSQTPEGFDTNLQMATEITAWVHCEVASCTPLEPLYYTNTIYLSGTEPQTSITVPLQPSAKEVFVISDVDFDPLASVSFRNILTRPFEAQYALPTPNVNVGSLIFTPVAGVTMTPWVPIPGTANALTANNNERATVLSIVQMLQT